MKTRGPAGVRIFLTMAVALAAPATAAGSTFEPTRFDDPNPGACKPNNCSLREAMMASNAHNGRDKIQLRAGRYEMEIPPTGDNTGSFDLRDEGVLTGAGASKTKIDANGLDTAVLVGADNELDDEITIQRLTITGGGDTQFGGGIEAISFENDKLTVKKVTLKKNEAVFGGGLHADLSGLRIISSLIARNESVTHGGGMRLGSSSTSATATAKITRSTIKRNESLFGGGIYNFFPNLTVNQSTIDGNTADEGGGLDVVGQIAAPHTTIRSSTISRNHAIKGAGLLADGNQPGLSFVEPIVDIQNTTIALNEATDSAGGILSDNAATVNLDNATVVANAADVDNTGGGVGGGVRQFAGAVLGVGDSILAANTVGTSGSGPQCNGALSDGDGFIYQSQSSGTCSFGGTFQIVADALIAPLADNGGPTETVKLLTGSPALGSAESCPARDQRGVKRPNAECDSGAFERKGD